MANAEKCLQYKKGAAVPFILSDVLRNLETWVYGEKVFITQSLAQNSGSVKLLWLVKPCT